MSLTLVAIARTLTPFQGTMPASSPRHMHVHLDAYFNATDPLLQLAKHKLCDVVATILAASESAESGSASGSYGQLAA